MLNRFETDENPYNICLTSADKKHHHRNLNGFKRTEFSLSLSFSLIHIRDYPCEKGNPQMLNRFETDDNPYNICLTSADKIQSSDFKRNINGLSD